MDWFQLTPKLTGNMTVSKRPVSQRVTAAASSCAEKPTARTWPAARASSTASRAPPGASTAAASAAELMEWSW